MNPSVREALLKMVSAILDQRLARELGFWLHGSHVHGNIHPGSDVDVLGIVADDLEDDELARLRGVGEGEAAETEMPVDLHIHRFATFAEDQYVDLRHAAIFLGGTDLVGRLPVRGPDDAAHEIVSIACQLLSHGELPPEGATRAKTIGYLISALVAVCTGRAPSSAGEAEARRKELPVRERALVSQLRRAAMGSPSATARWPRYVERVRGVILERAPALGPRCTAMTEKWFPTPPPGPYADFWNPRSNQG